MTEEVAALAEAPAPEQVATAEPVADVSTPEEAPAEQPATRVFTQEELDEAIGKRLARERRKWDRELATKPPPVTGDAPKVDQFDSPEAYAEALASRKAEELIAKRDAERQRLDALDAYHDREEEARNKYADFEQVAYNPTTRITEVMAETIQSSEIGPDVAYYLGSNPKEADRISRLSPILQAKEIGKIEARLIEAPPSKKVSSAPAPITPVTARSVGNPTYDTTDPRSVKSMSTSEWIEADRQRQIRKWESQRLR